MNYFVPNFGNDDNMKSNDQSLNWAEKELGHKWDYKKGPDGPPKDYFVPNFGVD